jgi:hypothetical protein
MPPPLCSFLQRLLQQEEDGGRDGTPCAFLAKFVEGGGCRPLLFLAAFRGGSDAPPSVLLCSVYCSRKKMGSPLCSFMQCLLQQEEDGARLVFFLQRLLERKKMAAAMAPLALSFLAKFVEGGGCPPFLFLAAFVPVGGRGGRGSDALVSLVFLHTCFFLPCTVLQETMQPNIQCSSFFKKVLKQFCYCSIPPN